MTTTNTAIPQSGKTYIVRGTRSLGLQRYDEHDEEIRRELPSVAPRPGNAFNQVCRELGLTRVSVLRATPADREAAVAFDDDGSGLLLRR